jgi:hypothetical protein
LKLERAQHGPGVDERHAQIHAIAVYAAIVPCTKGGRDLAQPNGTPTTRGVGARRRKAACPIRPDGYLDHTVSAVVLNLRPLGRDLHAHVRTTPQPQDIHHGRRARHATEDRQAGHKGKYACGFAHRGDPRYPDILARTTRGHGLR